MADLEDVVQRLDRLDVRLSGASDASSLSERQVIALESIAASLERLSMPLREVPMHGDKHVTSTTPGECRVDLGDQWTNVRCAKHTHLPPHTEAY